MNEGTAIADRSLKEMGSRKKCRDASLALFFRKNSEAVLFRA